MAWGEPGETLRSVLAALASGAGLISILAGQDAPLDFDAVEQLANGELAPEIELRQGGQPAYWWLLAAE